MSFFSDILLLFVLISLSSTFFSQHSSVNGSLLVDKTVLDHDADNRQIDQPVSSSSPVAHTLTQPKKSGAFSLELSGILTLVPVEEQMKKVCKETLTKFASTHCPFGDLSTANLASASNREKAALLRTRRHEPLRSIFAEHEMHYLQSQVERIIKQCCEDDVSAQSNTVIGRNTSCNLKTTEVLIEHACKPGIQRSGDILNG